jgi:acyl-CoA synthetase (AMP-forming)/AMP-acid ligase II
MPHRVDLLVLDDGGHMVTHGIGGDPPPAPLGHRSLDHVVFTSSTTGKPKAVMHSADTLAALNLAFTERFGLGPDRPIFMASPLGHSVGTYHGARLALWTGSSLVLQRRWDPEAALDIIAREGCAFTAAATPFLKDLLDAPWSGERPKLAPMTSFLCGGAQVPPALMEQAAEVFPRTFVTVLWGMTEGGLTTCLPESPREKLMTTAGIGLPGLEVLSVDNEGQPLAAGEEGELVMRGPGVFIGYCGQDDLYRSLLTETGYFRTGDLARVDADGYVQITGRLKDMIVRGGVNISPVPIEDAIAAHPAVRSVAVIGYPDERLGERICAVIVAQDPVPEAAEIVEFVQARGLPKSFWPEHVRCIDAMPATPAGKIRKNDLRAWLAGQIAAGEAPR